jgi:hypothetical protein
MICSKGTSNIGESINTSIILTMVALWLITYDGQCSWTSEQREWIGRSGKTIYFAFLSYGVHTESNNDRD